MAVWKPDLSNRHPSHDTQGCGADLDHLADLLAAKPNDSELRQQLADAMEGAGVSRHRGWVLEFRIASASTRPGRESDAAAWLAERGLRVPSGRSAKRILAQGIQRHVLAHGSDWPPRDTFDLDVAWTVRPS